MKKILTILLALVMLLTFAACSKTEEAPIEEESKTPVEENPAPSEEAPPGEETSVEETPVSEEPVVYTVKYPLTNETVVFDCFASVPSNIANQITDSLSEFPVYQIAEEKTGIHMDWLLTTPENELTKLNLIVASGEYPTYFKAMDSLYTAGKDASVEDEVAVDISGMLEEFAPDYYAFAIENDILKLLTSDAGYITSVAPLATTRTEGPQIRQDWLTELGLEVPTTVDELTEVALAFKNEKGCTNAILVDSLFIKYAPAFDFSMRNFSGGMEFNWINGEAVPFFMNENFIPYLDTLKNWYSSGLCSDYMSITNPGQYEQIFLNDDSGFVVSGNTMMGTTFINKYTNGTIDLQPISMPTMEADMQLHVGGEEKSVNAENAWTITTSCVDPVMALGYLNWFYTEEGNIAASFGREGEGLVFDENGEPTFSDLVMNNPDGLSMQTATQLYVGYGTPVSAHPTVQKLQNSKNTEAQNKCNEIWFSGRTTEYTIRGDMTAVESETYYALSGDIGTLFEEFMAKYINGEAGMEDYQQAVDHAYELGLEEIIKIKTDTHNRYLAR